MMLFLALGGWAVVAYVVLALPITPTTQGMFYAGGFVALAGTWASLQTLYHTRRGTPAPGAVTLLTGGTRFALVAEFALWLQSLRMLTPAYAILLAASYGLLEYLFRSADART